MNLTVLDDFPYAGGQAGGIEYKDGYLWINDGPTNGPITIYQYELDGTLVATFAGVDGYGGGLGWDGTKWWTSKTSEGKWLNENFTLQSTFSIQGTGYLGDKQEYRYDPINDCVWSVLGSIISGLYKLDKTTGAELDVGHALNSPVGVATFPGPDGRTRILIIEYIGGYLALFDDDFLIIDRAGYGSEWATYGSNADDVVHIGNVSEGIDDFALVGYRNGAWRIILFRLEHSVPATTDWRGHTQAPVRKRGHKVRALSWAPTEATVSTVASGSPVLWNTYSTDEHDGNRKALISVALRPAAATVAPTFIAVVAVAGDDSPVVPPEIVVPEAVQIGDFLLLISMQDSGFVPSTSGWTLIAHPAQGDTSSVDGSTPVPPWEPETGVWWKIATAGDIGSTIDCGGAPTIQALIALAVWRGIDGTAPVIDSAWDWSMSTTVHPQAAFPSLQVAGQNIVFLALVTEWSVGSQFSAIDGAYWPDGTPFTHRLDQDGFSAPSLALYDNTRSWLETRHQLIMTGGYAVGRDTAYLGGPGGTMDETQVFDLDTYEWSTAAAMPGHRYDHASCVHDGKLYVFGGYIAAGSATNTAWRFDPDTGVWSSMAPIPGDSSAAAVALSDGRYIYLHGGVGTSSMDRLFLGLGNDYAVRDLTNDTTETGWPTLGALGIGNIQHLAVSPDYTKLALVGTFSPYLRVIDVATKSIESGWPIPSVGGSPGMGVAWSPDGSRLAIFGSTSPHLAVIDVATKTEEAGWAAGDGGPYAGGQGSVIFSPSGDRIMTFRGSSYDVWLTATKARDTGWPALASATASMGEFSPDGTLVAIVTGHASAARKINVITVATKALDTTWPTLADASPGGVQGLGWSPRGDRLAVSNYKSGQWVAVIDVATKTVEAGWPAYASSMTEAVRFSPDDSLLAVGGTAPDTLNITAVATKTNETYGYGQAVQSISFGSRSPTPTTSPMDRLLRYDPLDNTWMELEPSPLGKRYHAGAYYNGRLYFVSGQDETGALTRDWLVYFIDVAAWGTLVDQQQSFTEFDEKDVAVATYTGEMVQLEANDNFDLTVWPPAEITAMLSHFWNWDEMSADIYDGVFWMIGGYPQTLDSPGYGDPANHTMSPGVPFCLRVAPSVGSFARGKAGLLGVIVMNDPVAPVTVLTSETSSGALNADAHEGVGDFGQAGMLGVEVADPRRRKWNPQ